MKVKVHKPAWVRRRKSASRVRSIADRFITRGTPSYDAVMRYADRVDVHGVGVR